MGHPVDRWSGTGRDIISRLHRAHDSWSTPSAGLELLGFSPVVDPITRKELDMIGTTFAEQSFPECLTGIGIMKGFGGCQPQLL